MLAQNRLLHKTKYGGFLLAGFGVFSKGYICVTISAHICEIEHEVMNIRRVRLILFSAVLFVGFFLLPVNADAASGTSRAGAVTVSSGYLNVRSSASASASRVASLKKGSYITLMEKSGSWWKVEYAKGKYGYCHSDYITIVQGTPVSVNTGGGNLNVRSGPGTSYGRTATLTKGETVLYLSTTGGWSRVLYHGTKTGYVSAQYLSNYYAAVSLKVPSFKQTDSRWANTLIGSSGKTMAKIGCATTAVAMVESYRTGTVITPDAMAKQLKYTATGNLYWPGHYTAVTSSSGYLAAIYNKLKQGKPVLLGAQNTYGSQHWVVITGFDGGTSLTAAGFSVHDPGSNSRNTLQQFLNAYPTFYKYFHY